MNKLSREFLDNGGQHVWWRKVVYALCECDEDGRDAQLVICKVFEDVGVERENTELVRTHDTREELHKEDLVVEGKTLVVPTEVVVEFLGKRLWVVEELQGREVGSG